MLKMADEQIIAIPIGDGGGMSVPQISPQNKADLLDKINPGAVVEIIRNKLMGRVWIDNKWVELPSLKDKRLNERGASDIADLMLGASTVSVSVSKLKDREIKKRLLSISKSAQYLLISNWKDYGIVNAAQFYYVHEIVFTNTLVVLKQADEASIQDLLKSTVQENRNVNAPIKERGGQKLSRMLGLSD